MGLNVFGFWLRRVVYVSTDIEVVVVLLDDVGLADQTAVLRNRALVGADEVDLFYVFRAELVLILALSVFPVDELIASVMGAAAEVVVLRLMSQINESLSGKFLSGLPSFERFVSDGVRQLGDRLLGNHSRFGWVYYLIDQLTKPDLPRPKRGSFRSKDEKN